MTRRGNGIGCQRLEEAWQRVNNQRIGSHQPSTPRKHRERNIISIIIMQQSRAVEPARVKTAYR